MKMLEVSHEGKKKLEQKEEKTQAKYEKREANETQVQHIMARQAITQVENLTGSRSETRRGK